MGNETKKIINTVAEEKKTPGVTQFTPGVYEDTDGEDIDSILKEELEAQGLEYRFIDFKQAKLNGGRSRAGWIVYRRQSKDPRIAGISAFEDSDGLVRSGTMVLAVKTKAGADRQRKRRDDQQKILNRYTKTVTQELDSDARKLGGSTRILAGYDKNR